MIGSHKVRVRPTRRGKHRSDGETVLVCGTDIQNRDHADRPLGKGGSAGASLGCFVETRAGEVGFFSSNIGIAALNQASVGDRLCRLDVDPGNPDAEIGTLRAFVPLLPLPVKSRGVDGDPVNRCSVALGILRPGCKYFANFVPGSGLPRVIGKDLPKVGNVVYKYTRGSRISKGRVVAIEQCIRVPTGGKTYRFDGIFEIRPDPDSNFDDDGDTATLVVREDGMALGMILAVDRTTRNVSAFPIQPALDALGCQLILPDRKSVRSSEHMAQSLFAAPQ